MPDGILLARITFLVREYAGPAKQISLLAVVSARLSFGLSVLENNFHISPLGVYLKALLQSLLFPFCGAWRLRGEIIQYT